MLRDASHLTRTATPAERSQLALAWIALPFALALVFGEFAVPRSRSRPFQFRVDPNHASRAQLMLLPGIGPTAANALVAARLSHADESFQIPADLSEAPGIGPRTVARITPFLHFPTSEPRE